MSGAGFSKRRWLGQHFLRDQKIINTIVQATCDLLEQGLDCHLLEIGPGQGALTLPLIDRWKNLTPTPDWLICERDRDLAELWVERAKELHPQPIRIESADFLKLPTTQWLPDEKPLIVVSNLPYSSGTAIWQRLAEHPERIRGCVLMFQLEVAARLRAVPSTKDWGSLSVWTQNLWEIRRLIAAPPGAFKPPPKVDSEVIIATPRKEGPLVPGTQSAAGAVLWSSLLKAAFAQRRKMLRSGFASTPQWKSALERSGVDDTKRAEALSWEDWRSLFEAANKPT